MLLYINIKRFFKFNYEQYNQKKDQNTHPKRAQHKPVLARNGKRAENQGASRHGEALGKAYESARRRKKRV